MRCSGSNSNAWRTRGITHGWCSIMRDRLVSTLSRMGYLITVCYPENVFTILTLFYEEAVCRVVFIFVFGLFSFVSTFSFFSCWKSPLTA